MPATTGGNMKTSAGVPLPLQSTDVIATVHGPIADVEVTQVFKNHTKETIEATYAFPLSHEGSVCRFQFKLGDRIIQGVIKEKEEAKRTYEAAKERGQAATLLEQNKENLFTMSVANIQAGETIAVHMGYQEKIPFDDGEYRFIFPLVATEEFDNSGASATSPKNTGKTATQAIGASDKTSSKVNVVVKIHPGVGIEVPKCLSHDVTVKTEGENYTVQLSPTDSLPNCDFVIAYKVLVKDVQPILYFEKQAKQDSGSFVMVITPPSADVNSNSSNAAAHAPLDVVFLVDRSYSMRGGSLQQCARAIEYLLEPLTEKDGVQLALFDHDIESFDNTAQWQACSPSVKTSIVDYIKAAKPRGGTELERALYSAIEVLPQQKGKQKIICLLTDAALGDLTRIQQLCEMIVSKENTRLYVLGVGPSVDRFAIQQLAKKANGVSEVLLANEKDIAATVSRFRKRLLEAGPIIQNLSFDWNKSSGIELYDMFPTSLPDLYSGQPLQVCGRYKGASKAAVEITIKGNKTDGSDFSAAKGVVFPHEEYTENVGVQRAWAKYKIDSLTESLSSASNQEEAKFDIIALSFQNVLMSKFTSFVAEEEDPKEKFATIKVKHGKDEVKIEGLKPSDKAKSILLRAAIACNAKYTGTAIKNGDRHITLYDDKTLIQDLDLKELELVVHAVPVPIVNKPNTASLKGKPLVRSPIAPTTSSPTSPRTKGITSLFGLLKKSPSGKDISAGDGAKDKDKEHSRKESVPTKSFKKKEKMDMSEERSSSKKSMSMESEKRSARPASSVSASKSSSLSPRSSSLTTSSSSSLAPSSSSSSTASIDDDLDMCLAPISSLDLSDKMESKESEEERAPPPPSFSAPARPSPKLSLAPGAPPAASLMRRKASSERSRSPGQINTREGVLVPPNRPASPWTPAKPWLSPDKLEFLKTQSEKLPEKAVPTATSPPVEYSKEDEKYMKEKVKGGQMDLAFVVDETGSMGSWISKVQGEIHNIVKEIQKSPLCKDIRIGLVGYRDHPPQDQMVTEILPLSSDIDLVKKGVDSMYASGGGDSPECLTDGMFEAVRLNWRPSAARVVVVITDAPPHGLPNQGDGFPQGCPCGNHWYTQAACMREMGIVCYTVGCGVSGNTETVYRTIANVTRGLYVNITNVQLLIPLITGAAETALDRQRLQELLLEVVMENLEALQRIEEDDKLVAELLRLLRARNVKLRSLSVHASKMGLHFEDLTLEDVQMAFDDLRRSERVAL